MKAVLLVSHGSKSSRARQEIDALAARLAGKLASPAPAFGSRPPAIPIFESAFLEIETPSIPEGLEACVRRGATEIVVLLNFLNSGRHVLEDIPRLVREFTDKHPAITCRITPCLGLSDEVDRLYLQWVGRTAC